LKIAALLASPLRTAPCPIASICSAIASSPPPTIGTSAKPPSAFAASDTPSPAPITPSLSPESSFTLRASAKPTTHHSNSQSNMITSIVRDVRWDTTASADA